MCAFGRVDGFSGGDLQAVAASFSEEGKAASMRLASVDRPTRFSLVFN